VPKIRSSHAALQTLAKFAALAEVFLVTLDALATKGLESDDRPRVFALTLRRWTDDLADANELATAARGLDDESWRTAPPEARKTPWALAAHAANALKSWRAQCMKYATYTRQGVPQCAWRLVAVWAALGEPEDAARALVTRLYADRFRAITGADPDVSPLDPAAVEGVTRFAHRARFGN
jgi:hypothetical protein